MTEQNNQIELDADGRHWLVVLPNGVRTGGFKTENDARRFLGFAGNLDDLARELDSKPNAPHLLLPRKAKH
jgi:hypothetical protein